MFVGCSVTPLFFRQITSFSDSFHHTKKQKNVCVGSFNMDTGVRDLKVVFFKASSTWFNDICSKDLSNRPI